MQITNRYASYWSEGETQCHNDQSFFTRLRDFIKEKLRGCVLNYAQALRRCMSQALYVPGCAIIVAIMSQQGWLSNYFGFSINNTR